MGLKTPDSSRQEKSLSRPALAAIPGVGQDAWDMSAPGARPSPRWSSLAREITIILIVKAAALYLIWFAFFSHPMGRHLDAGGVAQSLVPAPAAKTQPQ